MADRALGLVVEEGMAADDGRAPGLVVGGKLDRVLDVVLPQRLRLRRRLEGLRLRLAADGVCCLLAELAQHDRG